MMRKSVNLWIIVVAGCLALAAAPALAQQPAGAGSSGPELQEQATCGDCYWAYYFVDKGNQKAAAGIQNASGCNFPWGSKDPVLAWLQIALGHGQSAATYLMQANNTCSSSAANQGLTEAEEARDAAYQAVLTCADPRCSGNGACSYAGSAHNWYDGGVTGAQDCVSQTQ